MATELDEAPPGGDHPGPMEHPLESCATHPLESCAT